MGINDVFKKVFNVEFDVVGDEDDLYDDDILIEEDYDDIDDEPIRPTRSSRRKDTKTNKSSVPALTADPQSTVILIEPQHFNDAPKICDKLKSGTTVVVNMDKVDSNDAKKIFDFLSGAVYVLSASMKKIADNVFILAPFGIEIQTSMKVENHTGNSDSEIDDDIWEYDFEG